jgi:hypothetical protein
MQLQVIRFIHLYVWMRVQQHVNDAKDALNDENIVQAGSKLEIVDSLLDQLDAMTSKSD